MNFFSDLNITPNIFHESYLRIILAMGLVLCDYSLL